MHSCEVIATAALGPSPKKNGAELLWICPNHQDSHPSLAINPKKDVFLCGPCNKGGSAWRLVAFLGNLDPADKPAIGAWLREHGLERNNGIPPAISAPSKPKEKPKPSSEWKAITAFLYSDVLRKVRLERKAVDQETGQEITEKTFRWQHLADGKWKIGDGGNQKPLYVNQVFRECEQLGLALGFEGEAKADIAGTFGFAAFSFKNLTLEQCSQLADADIVLWPDKDKPGIDQAKDARKVIIESKQIHSLKTILPPEELPISGDIIDAVRDFKFGKEQIQILIATAKSEQIAPIPVGVVLAGVREEKIEWLWDQRIPLGAITVLDGDPKTGKSLLTIELISRITKGTPLPGSTERTEPGGVVILSAEDSIKHVIVPRLRVAGADMNRVIAVPYTPEFDGQPTFSKLPNDLPTLAKAIQRIGAKLVIFDVFMAYLPATLSANSDQDVRTALAPLSELADRSRCSVLLLRHLKKSPTANALYRGGGSIGIVGASRSSLLLAKDPAITENRIIAIVGSNYGGQADSLCFQIKAFDGIPVIEWRGVSKHTPESLLSASQDIHSGQGDLADAMKLLRQELAEGQKEAMTLLGIAKKQGISERTVRTAKSNLEILSQKEGHIWFWQLPD